MRGGETHQRSLAGVTLIDVAQPDADLLARAQRLEAALARIWESGASRLPSAAVWTFTMSLTDDDDFGLAYLDFAVEARQSNRPEVFSGGIHGLTNHGTLVWVDFDDDKVTPLKARPLRGRVSDIVITFDGSDAEIGRVGRHKIAVTVSDGSVVRMPLSDQRQGAGLGLVGRVMRALDL